MIMVSTPRMLVVRLGVLTVVPMVVRLGVLMVEPVGVLMVEPIGVPMVNQIAPTKESRGRASTQASVAAQEAPVKMPPQTARTNEMPGLISTDS